MNLLLKSFLGHLLGRRGEKVRVSDEAVAAAFRELVGRCPVCSGELNGHAHWRIAVVILDGRSEADRLARLVAAGEWENAAKSDGWAWDKDVREYHAIRCPNREAVGLVVAVFTYSPWSNDYVEDIRVLPQRDATTIGALAQDRWIPL